MRASFLFPTTLASLWLIALAGCNFGNWNTDMMEVYEEAIRRENRLNGEADLRQFEGPLAIRVSYYPPAAKNVLPEVIVKATQLADEQIFEWKYFTQPDASNEAYWEEPLESLKAREFQELSLKLQANSLDYIRNQATAILKEPYEEQEATSYTGIYVGLEMKDEHGFTNLLYREPFSPRQVEFFSFLLMTSQSGTMPADLANKWMERIKGAGQ